MLALSDLRQPSLRLPGISCLWLSPAVVYLLTLLLAVSLRPHRVGENHSWLWDYCFSWVWCCLEGSGLPEHNGCYHMGMTQNQDPGGYSLSSLPKPPSPVSPQGSLVHCISSLSGSYCLWLSPLTVNLVNWYSGVRLNHHRTWAVSLLGVGLLLPLRLLLLWGEWSAWAWWLLPSGGWLSTRITAATLSSLSPKLPSPVSLQASPTNSATLPLPEP